MVFRKSMRDYKSLLRALENRKKERAGKTMRINFQTSKVYTKEKLNVWIFLYILLEFTLPIIFSEVSHWFDKQETKTP